VSCVSRIVLRHVHVDVHVHVQINKSVVDFPLFNPNGSPLVATQTPRAAGHETLTETLTEHFDLESRNHDKGVGGTPTTSLCALPSADTVDRLVAFGSLASSPLPLTTGNLPLLCLPSRNQ